MKSINDFNFKDKKALVRVDFNVPLDENFRITDFSRIKGSIPTIRKILDDGGSAILMSHHGRPKDKFKLRYSLIHVVGTLSELLNTKVLFAEDCIGETAFKKALELKPGEVLLLENLRFHKEEIDGDEEFSRKLSLLGDIYVNDAFGTVHRAHASTAIIAKFFPDAKCFGHLMLKEIANIERIMNEPERPVTAIIGGAKVSDKVLFIECLMSRADNILIGGAMSYTFNAALGGKTGDSLIEKESFTIALELLEEARKKNVKLLFATDSIIADSFSDHANIKPAKSNAIDDGWMGLDIGPETIKEYTGIISNSKTILWNGPMGVFELKKFLEGTKSVGLAIAEATSKGAFSLIGGGDSVAAIHKFGLEDKVSCISTGGGAMLQLLEGIELPGIKAIND